MSLIKTIDSYTYIGFPTSDSYVPNHTNKEPIFGSGWKYKKLLHIKGSTGAGNNYPVLLKIGESTDSSGCDFHLDGNSDKFPSDMNDSGDLRFTDIDSFNLLNFWVEKVEGTAPNRTAYVWVKVEDDLDNDIDIYCYYGNVNAANISDGRNTFSLFDDFSSLSYDKLWTKYGSGTLDKGYGVLFTAGNGGQGLTTDGDYFYFGKSNGDGVDGTIYKYDFSGNFQTSFAGPPHSAGGSYRIDHDTILFCSGGVDTPEVWEISKDGTKLRSWNFIGEGYNRGALVAYKSSNHIYLFTSDTSSNFKIQEYQINDDGTWSAIGIEYSHTSLGVPQGLTFVRGYLNYLYDNGISKLQLNADGTITVLETLSNLPGSEKEGLTHWGDTLYYGDSNKDIRIIYNEIIADFSSDTVYLTSKTAFGKNTAVKMHCRTSSNSLDYPIWGYRSSDGQEYAAIGKLHYAHNYLQTRTSTGGSSSESGNIYSSQQNWTDYEIIRDKNDVKYYVADVLKHTESNNVPQQNITIQLGGTTHGESGNYRVSQVLVRKYISPEPSFTFSFVGDCKTYRIDHTKIDSDLTHFPVTLFLNSDNASELFQELAYDLNDDFTSTDGNDPNSALWHKVLSTNGSISIQSNKLHESISTGTSSEYTRIITNYVLNADFDIQIDFSSLSLGNNYDDVGCELKIFPYDGDSNNQVYIKAGYHSSQGGNMFMSSIRIGGSDTNTFANRNNSYGKLRLVKSDSAITTYYQDGDGNWVQLNSKTGFPTKDYRIVLGLYSPANNGNISVDFDNFVITSGTEKWPGAGSEGHPNRKKISLTSNNLTLYCEVEDFQPSLQRAVLHVSHPNWVISSNQDTLINLYYGAKNSDNDYVGDPGEEPAQNVWNSNFTAIYHLSQDPTGGANCIIDSTANNRHGTPNGSMTYSDLKESQVGRALDFDGGNDSISIPATLLDNTLFTVFVVFKADISSNVLIGKGASGESQSTNILELAIPSEHRFLYFYETGAGTNHSYAYDFTNSVLDSNYHFAVLCVKDGGHDIWFDIEKKSGTSGNSNSTATTAYIGYNGAGNNEEWNGIIDEVRFMSITPSDAWIKATYYSLFNELIVYS